MNTDASIQRITECFKYEIYVNNVLWLSPDLNPTENLWEHSEQHVRYCATVIKTSSFGRMVLIPPKLACWGPCGLGFKGTDMSLHVVPCISLYSFLVISPLLII